MDIKKIIEQVEKEEQAKVLNWEYRPYEENYTFFLGKGKNNNKRYRKHVCKKELI